ncbi:Uncharacterised protein [Bordetella pertussis]|nr:Uncharacterised protein [Bordetella pertussis]
MSWPPNIPIRRRRRSRACGCACGAGPIRAPRAWWR